MKRIRRRDFVRGSLAAGAAALTLPHARILGANSDIRVAIVGLGSYIKIGGKGRQEVDVFRNMPGVRVVALCDCDTKHLDPEVAKFRKRNEKVAAYTDVQKLLESKELDAIVVATPNHTHALLTIWGCQAEKDVFVEKPASHTIWEGRKMVEAARKYNRIVQSGSGPRSRTGIGEALAWARAGHLGKILYAHGLNYKPRQSIERVAAAPPLPPTLDFDRWAGPAPKVAPRRKHLHYDWHWDWSTGNGDLGNMGIHYLDACRWALGQQGLPPRAIAIGGRLGYDDDGQTPNTQIALLDYEPAPIIFEVRGLPRGKEFQDGRWNQSMDAYRGTKIGAIVHCENGYTAQNVAYDSDGKELKRFEPQNESLRANFITAVRSRKVSDQNSDILEGHWSASLVHLASISNRLGREAAAGEIADSIQGEPELSDAFGRLREHLAANGVDLGKTPAAQGPMLRMNPKKERFTGQFADAANRLATREYRQPYAVPDKV